MHNLILKELMSPDLVTVGIGATLDDVIGLMRERVFSCIVVVDNNKPAGIVTARDLVRLLADLLVLKPQSTFYIKNLMSTPVICVHQDSSLYEALVLTQTRSVRHLPVIDEDNRLVGLVTQTDITRAHFKTVEHNREIIEQDIRDRTQAVLDANAELKALALHDSLLGIGNRRAMEVDIHFTHCNAERNGRLYSCALIEVDYFQLYNDHYGHSSGDVTLKQIADSIKSSLRYSDRLYRYDGATVLVLMPETDLFEAVQAIHRVLENLDRLQIPHKLSPLKQITLSAGISCVENKSQWQDMVAEADTFLYDAKDMGRNQACWNVETPADKLQPAADGQFKSARSLF